MRLAALATALVASAASLCSGGGSSHSAPNSGLRSSAAAYPAVGTRLSFTPSTNGALGIRHCDYVCSADPTQNSDDFVFVASPPRNGDGAPSSVSFMSANFPDHALSPIAGSGGKVGVNSRPDADDATWTYTPGLSDATNYTLVSQSRGALAGYVLTLDRSHTSPCGQGNDIALLPAGASSADTQTWMVGGPPPPPPPPPTTVTVAADTVMSTLASSILGCHSDEGFMHQPQGFLSSMVYGEGFENTNGMRSGWSVATDNGAQGSGSIDPSQRFAAANRPSFHLSYTGGSGTVRLAHRGMGNEGLVFEAGKPYEGYVFARANTATAVTVALRDYEGGKVLATTVVNVPAGGAWTQLPYTLTPSGSTNCEGISSDPNISCNDGGFADYICIRCGGELSFGLAAPGDLWVGYVRLEPGAWGRYAGLPVRVEAYNTLKAMGVTALRYGGSVGSSVSWKDFRGPVWNRTSLGRTWASSDMSSWGPFDAMDFFGTANISVAVTMSDSDTPEYLADLVEYSLGDASTTWGALRIADGHPAPYLPLAWEIGNEQYNVSAKAPWTVHPPPSLTLSPCRATLLRKSRQWRRGRRRLARRRPGTTCSPTTPA